MTLFDVLAPGDANGAKPVSEILASIDKMPASAARQALLTIVNQAGTDIENARKALEDWYDSGMDRAAGWYKRKSQIILLALGLLLAVVTNTDSMLVAKTLWNTPALRDSTAKAAQQFLEENTDKPQPNDLRDTQNRQSSDDGDKAHKAAERVRLFHKEIQSLGLPVGWPPKDSSDDPRRLGTLNWQLLNSLSFWSRVFGWFLTGIALSLGAPFWFDTLNKFMIVRSTVKPKEKSREEASKDAK